MKGLSMLNAETTSARIAWRQNHLYKFTSSHNLCTFILAFLCKYPVLPMVLLKLEWMNWLGYTPFMTKNHRPGHIACLSPEFTQLPWEQHSDWSIHMASCCLWKPNKHLHMKYFEALRVQNCSRDMRGSWT